MSEHYKQQFNRLKGSKEFSKFKVLNECGDTRWMNANPESLDELISWATELKNKMEKDDLLSPLSEELQEYSERWGLKFLSADEMVFELSDREKLHDFHYSYLMNFIDRWNMAEKMELAQ